MHVVKRLFHRMFHSRIALSYVTKIVTCATYARNPYTRECCEGPLHTLPYKYTSFVLRVYHEGGLRIC
jgi:hypothetical protein